LSSMHRLALTVALLMPVVVDGGLVVEAIPEALIADSRNTKQFDRIAGWEQVAKVLPKKSLLIEYQRYQDFGRPMFFGLRRQELRYRTLLIFPTGKIQTIELGPAKQIEQKIQKALFSTEQGLADAQERWTEVSELVVAPLVKATEGKTTWFISPDAELNRIPFAALRAPIGDELLGEAVKLRLLTTGRELLDLVKGSKKPTQKSLVVANPSFDLKGTIASAKQLNWAPLPGAAKEGKAVAQLINAQLLMGEEATELAVKKQVVPKVLHFASHSYSLIDIEEDETPLLRSGIVLAGANQPDVNSKDD